MVSVVIPTHNYGRFVREAVESVQAQTVSNLEIIVVDDGSTDHTPAVLARIRDRRLTVVRTPNLGISAARNEGLRRARGEYIAFLDADDRWKPDKLELQLRIMAHHPDVGAIFTNFTRFSDTKVFAEDQFTFFPELVSVPSIPTRCGRGKRIVTNAFTAFLRFTEFPTWLQTFLFRASAIRDLRFVNGQTQDGLRRLIMSEDAHFALRAFRRSRVAYLADPLVEVRRHDANITKRRARLHHAKLNALLLLQQEPLTREERAALRRRIGRALVDAGRDDGSSGNPGEAAAAYVRALAYGHRAPALLHLMLLPGAILRARQAALVFTGRSHVDWPPE